MTLLVGALAGLLLLVMALVLIDPFNLNLLGRFSGGYNAAATALPKNTDVFIGVNLLTVDQELVQGWGETFEEASTGTNLARDMGLEQNGFDDFLNELDREWGITFEEDILPWIGQYAGVGIMDMDFDSYGEPEKIEWLMVVESRNNTAAEAFIDKFVDAWEENDNADFDKDTYQEITIYDLNTDYDFDQLALARSGNLVLVGSGSDAIKMGINSQGEQALADSDAYREAIKQLPADRTATFYIDPGLMEEVTSSVDDTGFGNVDLPTNGFGGTAVSVSLLEEGLRLDMVSTFNSSQLSQAQQDMLNAKYDPRAASMAPENTLIYLAGNRPDLSWLILSKIISDAIGRADFHDSMQMFDRTFGFDPDEELFPLFDGEWAVGVVPTSHSLLAAEEGINMGGFLLLESSDTAVLNDLAKDANRNIEDQGVRIDETQDGRRTTYELINSYNETPMLAYGLDDDYLVIATGEDEIDEVLGSGEKLADNGRFQQTWELFPKGMNPALYMNVTEFMEAMTDTVYESEQEYYEDVAAVVSPIPVIASASESNENYAHQMIMVFIESK